MATITLEGKSEKRSSKVSKQHKSGMKKSSSIAESNRRRSRSSVKSSGGLRRVMIVEPNSRRQSMKSDVSTGDSSVFTLRPLPPLLKNRHECHKSTENTSSYIQLVSSKPKLPPIKPPHPISSQYGKLDNNGRQFKCQRKMSQLSGQVAEVDDISEDEQFIPLRFSTPNNSKTALRSTSKSRTLPKLNQITFRQSSGTHQKDGSTRRNDSLSDSNHGGNNIKIKKEHRRLSHAKTRQWVRSSNFAIETADDDGALSSSESDSDSCPPVSSITFHDGRLPENRHKPTSTEQLRRIVSNIHPPSLPFKILVHERVTKFDVDLQFRVQHIKDWWSDFRLPRLPKIPIDIDFARSREAVRELCTRLRNGLRFRPPLILDPPPRFIVIPPSAWNLHQVSMTADGRNRHIKESFQQYNRDVGCYIQGNVAMVAGEDLADRRSPFDVASMKRRRDSRSGLHVTFVDEQDDGTINDSRRRRFSSSSRQASTKRYRRPLPQLPTSMTTSGGVSEVKFNDARERLASVLKKLDDPSWFGTWIAKHDEMEKDLKRLNHKRLDLIRALTFTVDTEPCQRSTNFDRLHGDDGAETRQRMRVHQQYAHHRFGMSQRQPSTSLRPAGHADAWAQGNEDMVFCSKRVQPMYTDDRQGCIACRVMKAARRYGCEDRLSELSAQPKIENYSTIVGDARQN